MSDVCLVLEGTYPYVRGGVSSWVHQIITKMPNIKFSIVCIMPKHEDTKEEKYQLPGNVESVINVYIHEHNFKDHLFQKKYKDLFTFFDMFYAGIDEVPKEKLELFLVNLVNNREKIDLDYAFASRDFWKAVRRTYEKGDPSISFLDFFWNYRFTFLPLIQIIKAEIPPAQLYHTISTGYAGVLASLAKIKFNSNMLLTEHGIYTKERRIEIAQASWIYESEQPVFKATPELSFFKNWWTKYFGAMSKLTYTYADKITTLYEGNRQAQIADGADPTKTLVIPNGINVKDFSSVERHEDAERQKTIAFVGRLVPIKDVKTLIKACKIIAQKIPDIRILFMGPEEEEAQYFQECLLLIKIMGLEKNIILTGHVDTKQYYPSIDLLLLTSISEAQPLVILEAQVSGVPAVATDVGSCKELLEGMNVEDKLLGRSGLICPIHSPEQIAAAALEILGNAKMHKQMSEAGMKRVRKFYNEDDMIVAYSNLYENFI